jgi:hypothetical protein
MIREVDALPWEGEYPGATVATFLRHGADTLIYTQRYYEVRNPAGALILGVGVALWSFVRPPELWVLLAKPYFADLRESLRITREAQVLPLSQYSGLVCDVARNNAVENHFVKHMGWSPSGNESLRPDGHKYIQFEVK